MKPAGKPPYVDFNVGFRSSSPDEFPKQRSLEGRFSGLIDLRERGYYRKTPYPVTVMIRGSVIVNFLPDLTRKGNFACVQLKTILRSSHQFLCGFAGISATTIPGLSPLAS
jgi:hypothetical protein